MSANAEDPHAWSGVTVVLPDRPVLAAVDVRGGSPFTVNTATLDPSSIVKALHGLVLSGGSAFGLEAAGGLTSWLSVRGRGASIAGCCIPTVPGAILYDLANGGNKAWGEMPLYRQLAARRPRRRRWQRRRVRRHGRRSRAASARRRRAATGVTVAALVAVNPVGSVDHARQLDACGPGISSRRASSAARSRPPIATGHQLETKDGIADNTTIGLIATDAALDQGQLRRLAVMAQDGYAYAIRPIHTHLDGDVVFALTTAPAPVPQTADTLVRLGAIAADRHGPRGEPRRLSRPRTCAATAATGRCTADRTARPMAARLRPRA